MNLSLVINNLAANKGFIMNNISHTLLVSSLITATGLFATTSAAAEQTAIKPAVMSQQEIANDISKHPRVTHEIQDDGSKALDVLSMLSSDKKFIVGKYQSEANREIINEPYGVDEYMYFLKGGVTLTASDGTVTEIKAGDSVTIPKE